MTEGAGVGDQGSGSPGVHPLRAVLFDLDGTLVDSLDLIVACWQHATETHLGYRIPREAVLPTIGRPLQACLEELAPGRGASLFATYLDYNALHHDALVRLPAGTTAMLDALHARGRRTGLVTAKRLSSAQMAITRFDLSGLLDVVVTFESTERHKPEPDPVLFGCARLGLPPAAVAFVGDSVFDMQAGRAAGAVPVGVAWGADNPANLREAGAVTVVADWDALLRWLDQAS